MSTVLLGPYELLAQLASGALAAVFLARDTTAPWPGRIIVLKILKRAAAGREPIAAMFTNEMSLGARMQHRNVVRLIRAGQIDDLAVLEMEYVFGFSLAAVLRANSRSKHPIGVGVLFALTVGVTEGLHHVHEAADEKGALGIVHRDVTPRNILVGFDGIAKTGDFGIAAAMFRPMSPWFTAVRGNASYMSPEHAFGGIVDRRSDLFSLGVVLWEALTGRALFPGSTPTEVFQRVRDSEIRPPSRVEPRLSAIFDGVVVRALARDPAARFATALEMRDEIRRVLKRCGASADPLVTAGALSALYGTHLEQCAVALRAAMVGSADPDRLAKLLGAIRIARSQIEKL